MLAIPESGISFSKHVHNCDLNVFCDWLEASLVFQDEPLTMSDVVDLLLENEVYEDQDFAEQFVASAWTVLSLRLRRLGRPFGATISGTRISKNEAWENIPAYAFCLFITCTSYLYPRQMAGVSDILAQGLLFERLSEESVSKMLPSWTVSRIGWSPENPVRLKSVIGDIIRDLNEVPGSEIDLHVDNHANELGLDILAYLKFNDNHASLPIFMLQCASGKNWKEKRKTPDLSVWGKIVNFNSCPVRGMSIPFSFADQSEFRRQATSVDGLFLDRYRLLSPDGKRATWVSGQLNADLIAYLEARVSLLPTARVTI